MERVYSRAARLQKAVRHAFQAVQDSRQRSMAHRQHAAMQLSAAQKEFSQFKAETGCTGVPVPLQVGYPGVQIASFFIIAGMHTVMLGSLVTLIQLVSAAQSHTCIAITNVCSNRANALQVNTHILTVDELAQVKMRCEALTAPQSEDRKPANVSKIIGNSKGGFKGDDLRRLLNGYLTYAYMEHAPQPVLQLFMLLEVS